MNSTDNAHHPAGLFSPPTWDAIPDLGLYMDQVITYLDQKCRPLYPDTASFITPAMVNNYVKSGVIDRPSGKKYNRDLLAQLIMLCTLKPAISLDDLKRLLKPADGLTMANLYQDFCQSQTKVFAEVMARQPQATALELALEAAICSILSEQFLKITE